MESQVALRPDWVIWGVDSGVEGPSRYIAFASDKITRAMVEQQMEDFRRFGDDAYIGDFYSRTMLEFELREFVMATGDSYASAIQAVLSAWNPQQHQGFALGAVNPHYDHQHFELPASQGELPRGD